MDLAFAVIVGFAVGPVQSCADGRVVKDPLFQGSDYLPDNLRVSILSQARGWEQEQSE